MSMPSSPLREAEREPVTSSNPAASPSSPREDMNTIEVDVLICGAGPAGAGLASCLSYHGITGLMISRFPSTVRTPRAHYTNRAGFEVLRDLGLEYDARQVAQKSEMSMYYRFCTTMVGEGTELVRTYAFSNDPKKKGIYEDASPCPSGDLPQTLLEPILVRYAGANGFSCRFETTLLSFVDDPKTGKVESILQDNLTKQKFRVSSKYLCGADGANSTVVRELGLPLSENVEGGLAMNVLLECDLTDFMSKSPGLLHMLMTPDKEPPPWAVSAIMRFVKPWTEWLLILIAAPGVTEINPSEEDLKARCLELIGDPTIPIKIKRTSVWKINESYAKSYSKGNVFCLGDATHRHSPGNGLGSNTCLQDAYNLAWKMAYVMKGKADRALLDSFSLERQPVGKYIVKRANDSFRLHFALYATIGLFEPNAAARMAAFNELKASTPAGTARRKALRKGIDDLDQERHSLGSEMNQHYVSDAVYTADETEEPPLPKDELDYCFNYSQSTYPGFRLPHAWLGTSTPGEKLSTQDLAGKGRFTLFTGIGGRETWTEAAKRAQTELDVDIAVYSIGLGQDYVDLFFQWDQKCGVEENGAVLVRPDRTVAWRCKELHDGFDAAEKLQTVMKAVLGRSREQQKHGFTDVRLSLEQPIAEVPVHDITLASPTQ